MFETNKQTKPQEPKKVTGKLTGVIEFCGIAFITDDAGTEFTCDLQSIQKLKDNRHTGAVIKLAK